MTDPRMTPTNDAPVTVEQDPYLATIEEFEHEDQRELCRLYNHRPDDSLQFSRSNMREAIRHGRRLAALASAPAGDGFGVEYDENDGNPDYTITWPDGRWLVAFRDQKIVVGQSPQNDQVGPTSHDLAALARPRAAVGEQQVLDELIVQFGREGIALTQEIYAPVARAILALQSPPAKVEG